MKPAGAGERRRIAGELATKPEEAESGAPSLDGRRTWLMFRCPQCQAEGLVARPRSTDNTIARPVRETATLADGSEVEVTVTRAVAQPVVRVECNACTAVSEVTL